VKLDFSLFLSILWNVNTLTRIISVVLISLTFTVGAFADSEKDTGTGKVQSVRVQSGVTITTDISEEKKEDVNKEDTRDEKDVVSEEKKRKIKQEISSYIIDSYKAQGDKILRDIDQTLQKTTPEKDDRTEAYKKIRTSLEARKNRNNTSKRVSETSKFIIGEFLSHMIESIDKRISELSK